MKKNTSFSQSNLKFAEKQSRSGNKANGQPDSSILSDKKTITPAKRNNRAFKEQDEFIDSSNNRKTESRPVKPD